MPLVLEQNFGLTFCPLDFYLSLDLYPNFALFTGISLVQVMYANMYTTNSRRPHKGIVFSE